jgi:hypothetical protein
MEASGMLAHEWSALMDAGGIMTEAEQLIRSRLTGFLEGDAASRKVA